MCRLTMGIHSEKCVVRQFCHCVNITDCTQTWMVQPTTHLGLWYSLLLLGYNSVQHVTVLNTVGNCNTVVL
jgi:hypothetical protein